jgi:hypothetical protein
MVFRALTSLMTGFDMINFIVQLKTTMKIIIRMDFQRISATKKSLAGFFRRLPDTLKV